MVLLRQMGNFYVTVKNHREKPHCLMHRLNPLESPEPLKQFRPKLPVIIIDGPVGKLVPIIHLHDLHLRQEGLLQRPEPFPVFPLQHFVRIGGVNIVAPCFGKRKIPCRREIPSPFKIVYFIRISCRNFLCPIVRASIHHYNFIHQIPDAVKAPCQDLLPIFNDHT